MTPHHRHAADLAQRLHWAPEQPRDGIGAMEGKQKVHLSQDDPPKATTIQGVVLVEILCARYTFSRAL